MPEPQIPPENRLVQFHLLPHGHLDAFRQRGSVFPGTGAGRTVVAFPVPGHAGNSAGGHPMLYHAVCLPVLPELHDEAARRKIK